MIAMEKIYRLKLTGNVGVKHTVEFFEISPLHVPHDTRRTATKTHIARDDNVTSTNAARGMRL